MDSATLQRGTSDGPPFVAASGYIPNALEPRQRHDSETLRSGADDSSQTLKKTGPVMPTLGRARATPRDLIDADYYGEWQNENKE